MEASELEPSPVLDNLDIDLVVKVLSHTAFSTLQYRWRSVHLAVLS
jgi:hypothetical protein